MKCIGRLWYTGGQCTGTPAIFCDTFWLCSVEPYEDLICCWTCLEMGHVLYLPGRAIVSCPFAAIVVVTSTNWCNNVRAGTLSGFLLFNENSPLINADIVIQYKMAALTLTEAATLDNVLQLPFIPSWPIPINTILLLWSNINGLCHCGITALPHWTDLLLKCHLWPNSPICLRQTTAITNAEHCVRCSTI